MKKILFIFISFSTVVLGQTPEQIPDRLIQDAELVTCDYTISPESEDTIDIFCFNNELFTGHTIGYMYDDLCIKSYSSGLLSYYIRYDKYGNFNGDQGFNGYGDEHETWGNSDGCEELDPLEYFEYWDNGNIKEHGIIWCGENLVFKSEYYKNGKIHKVSYFPSSQIYQKNHGDYLYNVNTSIIFDENSNEILQTD